MSKSFDCLDAAAGVVIEVRKPGAPGKKNSPDLPRCVTELTFRPRAAASVVPWRANGPGTAAASAAGARRAVWRCEHCCCGWPAARAQRLPRYRAARSETATTAGYAFTGRG
jgi:hypothetical protein